MRLQALNVDKSHTERWLAEAIATEQQARESHDLAKRVNDEAAERWYAIDDTERKAARASKPAALVSYLRHSDEAKREYAAAYAVWAQRFPISAEYAATAKALAAAEQEIGRAVNQRRHFETILKSKIHGTPLTQEVVA